MNNSQLIKEAMSSIELSPETKDHINDAKLKKFLLELRNLAKRKELVVAIFEKK